MQFPIDLVLSFREDDLLILKEINCYCTEGNGNFSSRGHSKFRGLRNCTILITPKGNSEDKLVPFENFDSRCNNHTKRKRAFR